MTNSNTCVICGRSFAIASKAWLVRASFGAPTGPASTPSGGGSFVMDDLLAVPAAATSVPEPGIFALMLAGLALLALARPRRAEVR